MDSGFGTNMFFRTGDLSMVYPQLSAQIWDRLQPPVTVMRISSCRIWMDRYSVK